ncbi:ABC1 FAMILY PROTEIN [Salix koriyanagi]|uniref:ABC1 FAMILY PROTEIN n=1 Tax=Salix koriyanagi TaxID=2511006 RepID=A0A9Q0W1V8_9ROSI|nr:ABC1 FAMILY PROTEIN [Salix koriyanagi]
MFLATAEGDHVALLSSFSEMGLKLRLDFPEQAMDFISVFFRTSTSASEAAEYAKSLGEQRARNMKVLPEKMNLSQRKLNDSIRLMHFLVIWTFYHVDARIVYHDIMRPFAESVLQEKLNLNENIADIWPEFGTNGKNLYQDWDECLKRIAMSAPETEPGQEQLYHYLSFGWLCGGIMEHASGKKFQEILEEAIVRPPQHWRRAICWNSSRCGISTCISDSR